MTRDITINDIRNMRKKFESLLASTFKRIYFTCEQQKIIIDALVYLEYKLKTTTSKNNRLLKILKKHSKFEYSVNSTLHSDLDVKILLTKISYLNTVNFQNVIDTYVETFGLPQKKYFDINAMLKNTNITLYPEANLAIRIFLLRGNFCWNWFPQTNFSELLEYDLSAVSPDSVLNCWEVVMLALYQADLVSLNKLKVAYSKDTIKRIYNMLKSYDMLTLDNIYKKLFNKSYIINFNKLNHVMLNVPFSQKQILRMLITEDFTETPTTCKLFSLWELWTDGRLGTVPKTEFFSFLRFKDKRTHPVTLHKIDLN